MLERVPSSVVRRLPLRLKRAVLFRQVHGGWPARTPVTFTGKVNGAWCTTGGRSSGSWATSWR